MFISQVPARVSDGMPQRSPLALLIPAGVHRRWSALLSSVWPRIGVLPNLGGEKILRRSLSTRHSRIFSFFFFIVAHDLFAAGVSFPIAVLLSVLGDPETVQAIMPMLLFGTPVFVVLSACTFALFGALRAFWRYAASTSGLLPIL